MGSQHDAIEHKLKESAFGVVVNAVAHSCPIEAEGRHSACSGEILGQGCTLIKAAEGDFADFVLCSIHSTQGPSGNDGETLAGAAVWSRTERPTSEVSVLKASVGKQVCICLFNGKGHEKHNY